MVVFTSGIVDECPVRKLRVVSTTCLCPCGVWVGVERGLVVRGGVGTLLGPEASGFWFPLCPHAACRLLVGWWCVGVGGVVV